MAKIEFELLLSGIKDATDEISKFAKSADSSLSNISSAFSGIGVAALAAIGGFSLHKIIEESLASEKALIGLRAALDATGGATESVVKDFEAYATSIQDLTGVSDEAVLEQVTLLKQLGATNDQAKNVISTATNLSAVLGKDLGTSVTDLANTFSGQVSRSLVKLIPELNNLTEAQLRAGGAVDLLNAKFPDVAKSISGSLTVKLKVLSQTFSDFLQVLGDAITQNDLFKGAIDLAISGLKGLTNVIKFLPDEINLLTKNLEILVLTALDFGSRLIPGAKGFKQEIAFVRAEIEKIKSKPIDDMNKSITEVSDQAEGLGKKFKKSAQQVLDEFKNLAKAVQKENFSPVEKIKGEQEERLKIVRDALKRGVISAKEAADAETAIRVDAAKKTFDQVNKLNEISRGILAESIKSPFGGGEIAKLKQQFIDQGATKEQLAKLNVTVEIGRSIGVLGDVFNGAKGATDAVTKSLGFLADSILPGIGGAFASIIGLLAKGPDEVRKNIDAFFTAIPNIINAIVLSIPAVLQGIVANIGPLIENIILVAIPSLITGLLGSIGPILDAIIQAILLLPTTLAESLPGIIDKLVQDAPRIISEAIAHLPEFFAAFAAQLPLLAVNFGISLAAQAPFIATTIAIEFIKNIPTIAKGVGDGIAKAFKDAIAGITNIGGNISDKAGGVGKSIGKVFGFADGGRIPNQPQFANDGGLAVVSANEQVLSKDLSSRLENFLNNGSNAGPMTVILQVGEAELAKVFLNMNQKGFRTA